MASIRTSLQLYDGMSPALRSITNVLGTVINSFESMQSVADNPINVASIQHAREELARANVAFDTMERNINEDRAAQQRFNNEIRNGNNAANDLGNKLIKIGSYIAMAFGGKKIIQLSDEMANMDARLSMMNDGMQTNEQLQNMIFQAAERSRGSYLATADAVGKMGIQAKSAFKNNAELVKFAEQLNKQFVLAGTSADNSRFAMLQLTQALGSGVLRGDELNSIFENAPTIIQSIADYMKKPVGAIRDMAKDGLITADIVKNAMLSAADETDKRFAQMPKTWGQIWTSMSNKSIMAMKPLLSEINKIANSSNFSNFQKSLMGIVNTVVSVVSKTFSIIVSLGSMIYTNWSWIRPIVLGVIAGMLLYNATALITNGILAAQGFLASVAAAGLMMQEGATFTATVAQHGLNAALWACPITWIVAAIIGLIVVFYAVIGAINKFAGTSISATGVIAGAFTVLGAIIGNVLFAAINFAINLFGLFWNYIASFVNFFANVWVDPINSVIRLFGDLVSNALGALKTIAKALDDVFGSNMAGAVGGWQAKLTTKVNAVAGGPGKVVMPKFDSSKYQIERYDYGNAYKSGYGVGKGAESKVKNAFSTPGLDVSDIGSNPDLGALKNNTGKTADNTAEMKDKMDITAEDLKYMRDIAERDVINKFTTAEIKVDMKNNMKVKNGTDLDGLVTHLENKLFETMQTTAEGVHG